METSILQKLNLNESEILVYETLLQNGEQSARQITLKTPLKRGLVYKTLEDLETKGLIIKNDETNKVSTFTPIHPNVLKGLAEQQLKQAREAKENLDNELGSFISMYNLANNKPGVEFYEGLEGLEKSLNDTLISNETIYTYLNILPANKQISTLSDQNEKQRIIKNISKKIILSSNSSLKNYTHTKLTETRTLKIKKHFDFYNIINIYSDKISFLTFKNNTFITTTIHNKYLYKIQRFYFESLWENLTPLN